MKSLSLPISALTLVSLVSLSPQAWAWGERGHHTVCEVATRLVGPQAKKYFSGKAEIFGHLCNVPDIHWRDMAPFTVKSGDSDVLIKPSGGDNCHFINPENIGFEKPDPTHPGLMIPDTMSIPLDFKKVEQTGRDVMAAKMAANPKVKFEAPYDMSGGNWWRTEQLYNGAIAEAQSAAQALPVYKAAQAAHAQKYPELKKEAYDALSDAEKADRAKASAADYAANVKPTEVEFNGHVLEMVSEMGEMCHFPGDAGQPLHNSANYDGDKNGHRGIHSYYEAEVVNELPPGLPGLVYDSATQGSGAAKAAEILAESGDDWAKDSDHPVLVRMRRLSTQSGSQINDVFDLDSLVKKGFTDANKEKRAQHQPLYKGYESRPDADELEAIVPGLLQKFQDMIVPEMAASARVCARLWDEIYDKGKLASFMGSYKSYEYPIAPPYVAPNFLTPELEKL